MREQSYLYICSYITWARHFVVSHLLLELVLGLYIKSVERLIKLALLSILHTWPFWVMEMLLVIVLNLPVPAVKFVCLCV